MNYPDELLPKAEAEAFFISQNLNRDYCCKYAYIHHDFDLKDNGEYKTFHTHMVIWCCIRCRKSTLINYISSHSNLPKECVSVEPCSNVSAMIRYLIHQDSPDKHRYIKEDIETNAYQEVKDSLEYLTDDIDGQTLEEIFKRCDYDKKRVAYELGATKYCRWRSYIELFCK